MPFCRYVGTLLEYQGTRSSWSNTVIKQMHERNVLAQNKNTFFFFHWYFINLLESYSTWYDKVIILGDFDIEAENKLVKDFL